jgi:hypothetical protein
MGDRLRQLKDLQRALKRGLALVQNTKFGGVAHHQLDVHVMDAGTGGYRGHLCIFKECPREGKRECSAPGCGASPFLQQFPGYRFRPALFEEAPKVLLFDHSSGCLVHAPDVELETADDVPF